MAARSIPARARWAVRTLDVGPSDRVLEIGCGRGVAVELVCEKLSNGTITAIDRSAAMVTIAQRRNASDVAAGKAIIRAVALAELGRTGQLFNKIFAINVSLSG